MRDGSDDQNDCVPETPPRMAGAPADGRNREALLARFAMECDQLRRSHSAVETWLSRRFAEEMESLRDALATSQLDARAAQLRADILAKENASLRDRVRELQMRVADAEQREDSARFRQANHHSLYDHHHRPGTTPSSLLDDGGGINAIGSNHSDVVATMRRQIRRQEQAICRMDRALRDVRSEHAAEMRALRAAAASSAFVASQSTTTDEGGVGGAGGA